MLSKLAITSFQEVVSHSVATTDFATIKLLISDGFVITPNCNLPQSTVNPFGLTNAETCKAFILPWYPLRTTILFSVEDEEEKYKTLLAEKALEL